MGYAETQSAPWWQVITIGRNPRRTMVRILVLVALVFFCRQYVILPIRVQGVSMLPTYKTSEVNFVNRLAYKLHEPQRGDVVSVKMSGESIMLCKRIVGLPGERVAFYGGKLFINGQEMEEDYVKLPCYWNVKEELVAPDEYYVVGDNRSMAPQDHTKGRAYRWQIVGRLMR